MRKFSTLLMFLLILVVMNACSTKTSSKQEYDFRNVRWGMSKEEVKKANSEDDLETVTELPDEGGVGSIYLNKDNYFCYESTDFEYVGSDDFVFTYFHFSKGKLDGTGYEIDSNSAPGVFESEESLDEFTEQIVADLTKKYGKYEKSEDDSKILDMTTYYWETKRTSVTVTVNKSNFGPSEVKIWYHSNEEKEEENNDL